MQPAALAAIAPSGLPIVPRGGGASYTDGYTPSETSSVVIDTSRMNRIVEINERDMYVVAQVGVTWAALNEALAAKGLRTPFFGPFSGLTATLEHADLAQTAGTSTGTGAGQQYPRILANGQQALTDGGGYGSAPIDFNFALSA